MLVPDQVCYEDIPTVLEGTTTIHQPAIHQQLRSWLYILASDADDSLPVGMRGQNNLSAHQVRDGITQAPQFVSRQQAFWESQLGQESPQGVTCICLQCRKLAFHAVMLRPGREGIAGSGGGAELLIQIYKRLAVRLHVRCISKRDQRLESIQSEEHTSELQSHLNLVCRLLLEKKKNTHHLLPVLFLSPHHPSYVPPCSCPPGSCAARGGGALRASEAALFE